MSDADALALVAGTDPVDVRPSPPFPPLVLDFLAEVSARLRADAGAPGDVQAFAFWCRRGNLERLRAAHDDGRPRLGRGLLFHVAPANVPVNFAFSLVFGLLAGCANVVRLPSAPHRSSEIVAAAIAEVLARPAFADLARANALVRYDAASGWSARFSARADGRLIWGGDATVAAIRVLPTPPRCVDVAFADRTSLCVMATAAVAGLDAAGLERLADGFFNDTYALDQNACSSPHLVLWLGRDQDGPRRFWAALERRAARDYRLAPVQAVDKYADLLAAVVDGEPIVRVEGIGAGATVATLAALPADLAGRRGRFGLFRQMWADTLDPLVPLLDGRFQTLTHFGLDPAEMGRFVIGNRLAGIDRVVPVGRALDIGLVWDGFDLIAQLTRVVDLG